MSDDFDDPAYHKALPWLRSHEPPKPIMCSQLQSRFAIGYNRAMRILERAETEGILKHDRERGGWALAPAKQSAAGEAAESMSLGEALPLEMARVRDKLLPRYDAIPTGFIAAAMMRHDLDRAAKALASGDAVEMLLVYTSLKGFTG